MPRRDRAILVLALLDGEILRGFVEGLKGVREDDSNGGTRGE